MLHPPRALLLDFGGTIVTSYRLTPFEPGFVERVHGLVHADFTIAEVEAELKRADAERDAARDASEDLVEVSHERLWGEFVAKDWPEASREAVVAQASELTYAWARRSTWRLRDGITDLLDYTVGRAFPVAVVSNTRCGAAHRAFLDDAGLPGVFTAQIYSDELGFYKPHPEMINAAVRELGVPAADCWMVGDLLRTDIECARRAGAGAAILMTDKPLADGEDPQPRPDAIVQDGKELLELLKAAIS